MTVFRWNVGPGPRCGYQCLRLSVKLVRRLWPGCRYVVCYNSLPPADWNHLPDGVELACGNNYLNSFPFQPFGAAWKVYPPRLAPDDHEIILDNDIVLYGRPPQIDEFLASDRRVLAAEDVRRAYDGELAPSVPDGFNVNAGLVCLPPGYDYGAELRKIVHSPWEGHCGEQAAAACVFSKCPDFGLVPLTEVSICGKDYLRGKSGIHFTGLNRGLTDGWNRYVAEMNL